MNRPASIITFERLYLGSFAVWLIGLIVFWGQFQHRIATAAAHYPSSVAGIAGNVTTGSVLLVGLVTLLLWYFVARRRSQAAAWIVIVTEAFGALTTIMAIIRIASGRGDYTADGYVNLAATVMAVAAAVFLLRADARDWLGAKRDAPGIEAL